MFFRRGDDGSQGCEVLDASDRTEAAGDFLLGLHHTSVALALVVGKGHGGIAQEAQGVLLAGLEPRQEIVSGQSGEEVRDKSMKC